MESSRLRRRSNSTESCRFDARSIAFYPGARVDRLRANDSSGNEDRRLETFMVDRERQMLHR